ncbi:MAG: hypothetical protein WA369_18600 [Candidatus Acidiferrales bacterium]
MRDDGAERRDQSNASGAQFVAVGDRKALEEAFTSRSNAEQNLTGVGTAAGACEQSLGFEAAAQFNCGVMPNLEPPGERANRGSQPLRQSFDGEQGLMLLWLDARLAGGTFAEIEEAPNFVTEAGEGLVVDLVALCTHAFHYIVLRYTRNKAATLGAIAASNKKAANSLAGIRGLEAWGAVKA